MTVPDGPILKFPEVPWTQPESVFDSGLTRAMRAINDLLGGNDPNSIMGIVGTLDVPGGAGALQKALGGLVKRAKKGIKAYHGSPHDFERFDVSKIGTGEGAQAYGHGLYFAEDPKVANTYREALATPEIVIGGKPHKSPSWAAGMPPDQRILRRLGDKRSLHPEATEDEIIEKVRADLEREGAVKFGNWSADSTLNELAQQRALLDEYAAQGIQTKHGRMYEVAIDADPEDFLDWDKPLSQQSEKVKGLMRRLYPQQYADAERASVLETQIKAMADQYGRKGDSYKDAIARAPEDVQRQWKGLIAEHSSLSHISPGQTVPTRGEEIYRQLPDRLADVGEAPRMSERSAQEDATEALRRAGIPGIKYLDAGSRTAGEGSRNYVVFDDKLVSILRKYGVAGAVGAGYTMEQVRQAQRAQGGGQ